MSVLTTLASDSRRVDLTLAIRVEGIPYAFVERTIAGTGLFGLAVDVTQIVCLTSIREGETRLDLLERRQVDATLDAVLLDDDSHTLRSLFAHNARPATWLTADVSASGTTLTGDACADLTSPVYLGTETVSFTGQTATTLTGCTRGAFGSVAAKYKGTADDGDSVYQVPPSWTGRRAYLYAYTLSATGATEERLLSTWLVDESPQAIGDDEWSLRLGGLSQEYFARPVMAGVQEVTPFFTIIERATADTVDVKVNDVRLFQVGANVGQAFVTVTSDNGVGDSERKSVHEIISIDAGTYTVTIRERGSFHTPPVRGWVTSMQMLGVYGGPSSGGLLSWLLSRLGDTTNSGYDVLPGRDADVFDGVSWRTGAGFALSEVDDEAIEAISFAPFNFAMAKETPVGSLIREVCQISRCTSRITRDGKLTIVPLSERATSALTFDEDILDPEVAPTVEHDEGALSPLLTVLTNYDPIKDVDGFTLNLVDVDLVKRYPRAPRRREVTLRGVWVDRGIDTSDVRAFRGPTTMGAAELVTLAADLQRGEGGRGVRVLTVATFFDAWSVELGDVIELGTSLPTAFAGIPDFEGGALSGARCRVIGRRPDYELGRITWRLQILEPLLVVCPAALVSSRAGAVVTLVTGSSNLPGGTSADFWVGAKVRYYDASTLNTGAPIVETREVIGIGANTLTLDAAPAFGHTAGDYVVLDPATSADGTSSTSYTLSEMATTVEDDGIGSSPAPVNSSPRWR